MNPRTLTEKEFEERFTLVKNEVKGGACEGESRFETFGPDWEFVSKQPAEHVWTAMPSEDNDKDWVYLPGFHVVNKEYYIVTEEPWDDSIAGVLCAWGEKTTYSVLLKPRIMVRMNDIEAYTQEDAVRKAIELYEEDAHDLVDGDCTGGGRLERYQHLEHAESEDVFEALVDEVGDEEFENTRWYMANPYSVVQHTPELDRRINALIEGRAPRYPAWYKPQLDELVDPEVLVVLTRELEYMYHNDEIKDSRSLERMMRHAASAFCRRHDPADALYWEKHDFLDEICKFAEEVRKDFDEDWINEVFAHGREALEAKLSKEGV